MLHILARVQSQKGRHFFSFESQRFSLPLIRAGVKTLSVQFFGNFFLKFFWVAGFYEWSGLTFVFIPSEYLKILLPILPILPILWSGVRGPTRKSGTKPVVIKLGGPDLLTTQ